MNRVKFLFLLLCSFILAAGVSAQETSPSNSPNSVQDAKVVKNPELRENLLKRSKTAVAAREELRANSKGAVVDPAEAAALLKIDRENAAWVKSEIEKHGWLGIGLVGEDGEKAAFQLVLVAIHDAEFQKRCLELLRVAVKNGDAPAEQVERLAAMINQAEGLPKMSSNSPNIMTLQNGNVPVQPNEKSSETVKNPKLRDDLLERMKNDQTIRMEAAKYPSGQPLPAELVERFRAIDQENTAWMKKVIEQYGYPGYSMVGKFGEAAAFLLIQHASQDLEFQKGVLVLMRGAVEQKDASAVSLAYLTDRILVAQNKPQIYGTQMRLNNGKPEPAPIEDAENVDKRRAEIGLPPLADYVRTIINRNQKSNP